MRNIDSTYKKQIIKLIKQHKKRKLPEGDVQVLGEKYDQIQNQRARGAFDVEALELDVWYKLQDINQDYYCSKNCLPSLLA